MSVSAADYTELHGLSMPSTTSFSTMAQGLRFVMNQNDRIVGVVKANTTTITTVYLSSNAAGTSVLASATFVGDVATFAAPYEVTKGTVYYILQKESGATSNYGGDTVSVNHARLNWTGSVVNNNNYASQPTAFTGVILNNDTTPTDSITFSGVSVSSSTIGSSVTFRITATITGTMNLTNYTFSYDNCSGTLVNDSVVALSGKNSTISLQKNLSSTYNCVTRYQWFLNAANATNKSSTNTSIYSFNTTLPTPNGSTNWTRLSDAIPTGNPVGRYAGIPGQMPGVAHGEPTSVIEGNVLYQWFHSQTTTGYNNTIILVNTTNPYNVTNSNAIVLNVFPDTATFPALMETYDYTKKVNGNYTLFVVHITNLGTYSGNLYKYTSSNKYNWSIACGGSHVLAAPQQNPAAYYDENGTTHLLIEDQGAGKYYTSSNGCNFTLQGTAVASGFYAPWIRRDGGMWTVYYTSVVGTHYEIFSARGTNMLNLSAKVSALGDPMQAWDGTLADSDIVIVPSASQQYFPKKTFMYYIDQNQTGLAFDVDDRSYFEIHNVTMNNVAQTISLSVGSPANNTFTYDTTPDFTFTPTIVGSGWNVSLVVNGTVYASNNTLVSSSLTTLTPTLTGNTLYSWWLNATHATEDSVATTPRSLYVVGASSATTLACLVVSNGCTITSSNGCNYVQ
jgi:hypothetical protein